MKLKRTVRLAWDVLRSPRVSIECFGGPSEYAIFSYFNSRHPKLPLFRRKTFGAVLREIPLDPQEIDQGSQFSHFRRRVRRAQKAGFEFARFDPHDQFDAIMQINSSADSRQGAAMPAEYVDPKIVRSEMDWGGDWFGVFSSGQRLHAYAYVPIFGEVFVFWKILGDSTSLDDGVMYLLVDGTLRAMVEHRQRVGVPVWAMYDMYIGGGDGLREFKRRIGFSPKRVKWRWTTRRVP